MKRRLLTPILFYLGLQFGAHFASSVEHKEPLLLKANDITHENELSLVTATGDVELSNGEDTLRADKVIYNQKLQNVIAVGNVKIFYKSGDIISSEYLELTDDFKDGFIDKVYILLADNSRLAAADGFKRGHIITLNHALYSPCNLCQYDEQAPPTWQIKASEMQRDEVEGDVYYSNARMEFLGAPIFYLPFLSHADPSIDRRSGFMPPMMGYSSRYGFMTGLPYYYVVSPSADYTLIPIFTTEGGVFLDNELRKRFASGDINVKWGVGYTDNKDWTLKGRSDFEKRHWGHLFAKGEFSLDQNWRFKFDINKVDDVIDDRRYLRRYDFLDTIGAGTLPMLESTAAFEGFFGNNYFVSKGYWFQEMRERADRKKTPHILPYLYYQGVSDPGKWGEYWTIDLNEMMLVRQKGSFQRSVKDVEIFAKSKQTNRVFGRLAVDLPFSTGDGSLFNIQASIHSSLYSIKGYHPTSTDPDYTGSYGRAFPQVVLGWRKPYYSLFLDGNMILAPVASFVAGPNIKPGVRIPNEDSQEFELSMGNLFSADRLSGFDRIDGGRRLNYGINMYYFGKNFTHLKLFIGQSYSFTEFLALPNAKQKGIYKGFSDYILEGTFSPVPGYTIEGAFMLDRDKLNAKRSSITFSGGSARFKVRGTYLYTKDPYIDNLNDVKRHQLEVGFESQVHEYWKVMFSIIYDLTSKPGAQSYTIRTGYQDECFGLTLQFMRSYFSAGTIKPSDSYLLTFSFKNLGTYDTGTLGAPASSRGRTQLF